MDRHIRVTSPAIADLALRSIAEIDCENLRVWKNENRQAFFYKQEISYQDQRRWYKDYLTRPDDYMFVVVPGSDVGCMGFRFLEGKIDVYNVIRASREVG